MTSRVVLKSTGTRILIHEILATLIVGHALDQTRPTATHALASTPIWKTALANVIPGFMTKVKVILLVVKPDPYPAQLARAKAGLNVRHALTPMPKP